MNISWGKAPYHWPERKDYDYLMLVVNPVPDRKGLRYHFEAPQVDLRRLSQILWLLAEDPSVGHIWVNGQHIDHRSPFVRRER